MGDAKLAEITQMPAITSLAHNFDGLGLCEIKQNCMLQLLKVSMHSAFGKSLCN
jgi:hypothetical protein